jgi:hypothetical protein
MRTAPANEMIKALLDAGRLSEREALDHARVERALAAGGESESAARSDQCPLWPTLRTHGGHPRAPRSATKRHMQCSKLRLFDHLVGEREQSVRHLDAEHPGGRVVDDQLELRCLHDR